MQPNNYLLWLVIIASIIGATAAMASIKIVAAESVYGEVVQELAGNAANVVSIIHLPNQDPHLFTVDVNSVKKIKAADMIIYNGAEYDPWIKPFLTDSRQMIVVVTN